MKLSIVTTLYCSEPYIEEFYRRASNAAQQLVGNDYEFVIVDDGSPDNSLHLAVKLAERDTHVKVLELSRNFGHHKAMMTGLMHAQGELVFLIDSDLEEEPEWLNQFALRLQDEKCDVVYGVQENRKGNWFEKISGKIFYKLFRILTKIEQPDNIVTARLMKLQYVQHLCKYQERELNIGGIFLDAGYKQITQLVNKGNTSPTTYNLTKKVHHLVNAIISFSSTPLNLNFYFGLMITIASLVYIIYLIGLYVLKTPPSGYTSVVASVSFFSGIIIFFQGLQGIYISKIYNEVKQRPYTILKKIYWNGHEKYIP